MPDTMNFPNTFDEFAEQYKIVDDKEIYTNGTELIPIFRVKQWLEYRNKDRNEDRKVRTNFDRIKAMSIKEMADNSDFQSAICSYIQEEHHQWCWDRPDCVNCIREFLESEVQEDDR